MRIRKDITGQRFGRLMVLAHEQGAIWNVRCDCGTERRVLRGNLVRNHTLSCGCLNRESLSKRRFKHGGALRPSQVDPLYRTWVNMRSRCYSPHRHNFKYYGGRGITVCDRWSDFAAFKADMGPKPSAKHTLDRIDPDGPYSPENCRWASAHVQRVNRSRTGGAQPCV